MEIVDVKSARGLAKVGGTVVSFAGVTTMTLYKGPAIASPWKAPIHIDGSNAVHQSWLKGAFLAVASCVCWSIWYIMQATSVKRYPAELSLTAWMATVGGIQSLAFTVILKHHKEDWLIGFGLKFWCIIYSVRAQSVSGSTKNARTSVDSIFRFKKSYSLNLSSLFLNEAKGFPSILTRCCI
jgi:drug/metabolite transporter (DMT)-like permease